jgi:predicted O-methyltransferase YrrM
LHNSLKTKIQEYKTKGNHLLRAKRGSGHGIHSPYLYRFIAVVLNTPWPYYAFDEIESFRKTVENSNIRTSPSHQKKTTGKTEQAANRDTFRIIQDLQPETMLEMGTTNGFSTLYMAKACPSARCLCITKNTNDQIQIAETFKQASIDTIEWYIESDQQPIYEVLDTIDKIDLVVLHISMQPLEVFKLCMSKAHLNSIFIIRQIHQTSKAEKIWKELCQQTEVVVSIDLYDIGILLFRPELKQKNYRIRNKKTSV